MGEFKPQNLAEWLSILDLSCRWTFDGIRNLAIKGKYYNALHRHALHDKHPEIEKLATEPVDRITICLQYDIKSEWLLPAYLILCERSKPLSLQEAKRINSLEIVTRLAQAREAIQRNLWSHERDFTPAYWVPPHLQVTAPMHNQGTQGLSAEDLLDQLRLPPAEKQRREHMNIVAKHFDLPKPAPSPARPPAHLVQQG